jgi:hypothetical protein
MSLRTLLATSWIAVALGVFAACRGGGGPEEESSVQEIPDEAVQSDEAAPSQPSPEDSL